MRIIYVSVIIVIIDQLTKMFVKGFSVPFLGISFNGLYPGEMIPVAGDFFRITFIENPGMAFGLDPGTDFKLWLSVFSLVASIGLVIYIYYVRDSKLSLRLALAFILGGAVGNLIDRMFYGVLYGYAPLFYGKVVDFLDFDFFSFTLFGKHYERWPIFNIADASVTIGVLILIFFYKKDKKAEEETTADTQPEVTTAEIANPKADNPGQLKESPEKKDTGDEETDQRKEIPL
ncbi:MAG: hypothetical protein Kow0098_04050 [Ignavibacteriaceae bacterium]